VKYLDRRHASSHSPTEWTFSLSFTTEWSRLCPLRTLTKHSAEHITVKIQFMEPKYSWLYPAYNLEGFWHVKQLKYIKISNSVQNLISDISSTLQRYGSDCGISNKKLQLQKYFKWCKPLNQLLLLEAVGRDSCWFSDSLWAARSGNQIPVGEKFSAPVQNGPGAHPDSYTMGTGSFPGVKRPEHGIYHPPPSSAEIKERVELYFYSPSGPLWTILGWTLPYLIYY
jgi:hypothetical protein